MNALKYFAFLSFLSNVFCSEDIKRQEKITNKNISKSFSEIEKQAEKLYELILDEKINITKNIYSEESKKQIDLLNLISNISKSCANLNLISVQYMNKYYSIYGIYEYLRNKTKYSNENIKNILTKSISLISQVLGIRFIVTPESNLKNKYNNELIRILEKNNNFNKDFSHSAIIKAIIYIHKNYKEIKKITELGESNINEGLCHGITNFFLYCLNNNKKNKKHNKNYFFEYLRKCNLIKNIHNDKENIRQLNEFYKISEHVINLQKYQLENNFSPDKFDIFDEKFNICYSGLHIFKNNKIDEKIFKLLVSGKMIRLSINTFKEGHNDGNHSISIKKLNDEYYFYDPNYLLIFTKDINVFTKKTYETLNYHNSKNMNLSLLKVSAFDFEKTKFSHRNDYIKNCDAFIESIFNLNKKTDYHYIKKLADKIEENLSKINWQYKDFQKLIDEIDHEYDAKIDRYFQNKESKEELLKTENKEITEDMKNKIKEIRNTFYDTVKEFIKEVKVKKDSSLNIFLKKLESSTYFEYALLDQFSTYIDILKQDHDSTIEISNCDLYKSLEKIIVFENTFKEILEDKEKISNTIISHLFPTEDQSHLIHNDTLPLNFLTKHPLPPLKF